MWQGMAASMALEALQHGEKQQQENHQRKLEAIKARYAPYGTVPDADPSRIQDAGSQASSLYKGAMRGVQMGNAWDKMMGDKEDKGLSESEFQKQMQVPNPYTGMPGAAPAGPVTQAPSALATQPMDLSTWMKMNQA